MSDEENQPNPNRFHLIKSDDLVLLSLSLLAIGIIVYDAISGVRHTNPSVWRTLAVVDLLLIGYFVTVLAEDHAKCVDRSAWWKKNFLLVIALFPLFATLIPGLGWAGILRFLRLYPAFMAILRLLNVSGSDDISIQQRIAHLFIIVFMLIIAGGVLALMFEVQFYPDCVADPTCDEGQMISSLGDAIWWSIETATTVGYGEFAPKSIGARVTATMLMFVGIGTVGTLAATLSQLFYSAEHHGDAEIERFLHRIELLSEMYERGDLSRMEFKKAKQLLLDQSSEEVHKFDDGREHRLDKLGGETIESKRERAAELRRVLEETVNGEDSSEDD